MSLARVDITRATVRAYIKLKVRPDQEDLVSPNAATLAECAYEPTGHVWGLTIRDEPVGLIAMKDLGAERDAAYLWRLMISAGHQGRGYGRRAIEMAFEIARDWGRRTLLVHVAEAHHAARPLYEALGFEATDQAAKGERLFTAQV